MCVSRTQMNLNYVHEVINYFALMGCNYGGNFSHIVGDYCLICALAIEHRHYVYACELRTTQDDMHLCSS